MRYAKVTQFAQYNQEMLTDTLQRDGKFTIDSEEFKGTSYLIERGTLCVIGGKNGILSFDFANAERFLSEIKDIVELYGRDGRK